MAGKRHPKHERIVDMLCDGVPYKVIAFRLDVSYRTVDWIAGKYTKLIRVRKFDPGEGQRNFFDFWKNL